MVAIDNILEYVIEKRMYSDIMTQNICTQIRMYAIDKISFITLICRDGFTHIFQMCFKTIQKLYIHKFQLFIW